MSEKVGEIDKKVVERARKERRFLYIDWNTASVMLSDVSAGGKSLSDADIEARKVNNEKNKKRKKAIREDISDLRKSMAKAGRKGDASKVGELSAKIAKLEGEGATLVKKPIPKRK